MDLRVAIQKGININIEYNKIAGLNQSMVSIDCLKQVIEDATKLKIALFQSKWAHQNIEARLNRYKENADIFVLEKGENRGCGAKMTYCDTRFATTKELAHLVIDSTHTYTKEISKLIEDILYSNVSADISEEVQSEIFAEVVAMQLLFPWELRQNYINDLSNEKLTTTNIAEEFKVPKKMIEWILSNKIHKHLTGIYDEIELQ